MTTQEDRLQMALDRLASNGSAVVEALRRAGQYNLALQTQHDLEALATLATGIALAAGVAVTKMEGDHAD